MSFNNNDLSELQNELKRVSAQPGQAQTGGGFMDNFVKMPESDGLVVVRLLPSKSGKIRDIYQSTRIHSINNQKLHCPRELVGERWQGTCPICDYYNWLWKESKNKTSKEEIAALQAEARSIKPVERYYFNCIVLSQTGQYRNNQPNKLNIPLILSVGKQVFARILRAMLGSEADMEPALGNVTDVLNGRNFKILKKTKVGNDGQKYPSYDDCKFLDPSPLGTEEQIKAYLEGMFDLVGLRDCKPADELKREIRIHRRVEKDPRVGFDLAELGIGVPAQVAEHKPIVQPAKPVAGVAGVKQELTDEDKGLLDSDFLQKMDAFSTDDADIG